MDFGLHSKNLPSGSFVLVLSDNTTAVSSFVKRKSAIFRINQTIIETEILISQKEWHVRFQHVPGALNVADAPISPTASLPTQRQQYWRYFVRVSSEPQSDVVDYPIVRSLFRCVCSVKSIEH